MNDSNGTSRSNPRPTLRLKVAPRKSEGPTRTPPAAQPMSKSAGKPGARWSDEYTQRMQVEMDALASRS